MPEESESREPLHDEGDKELDAELLRRAENASSSGKELLGMFLYLAAFQQSVHSSKGPDDETLEGLKRAWELACQSRERSLAEYIFELLEPFLNNEELASYAERLQALAFDRLEEMGISRSDIDEIAQLISDELVTMDASQGYESIFDGLLPMLPSTSNKVDADMAEPEAEDDGVNPVLDPLGGSLRDSWSFFPEGFGYSQASGYGRTIALMRELGIADPDDLERTKLVEMLNYRHGLESPPALDTILLRSLAREDANRFMVATVGELGLPAVHMRMEEGFQGSPVLCISTHGISDPTPMGLKASFSSGGVLILENLDLWESPVVDMPEDGNPFFMMQMTRGAKEAMGLVRMAVDDPNVIVLATSSTEGTIDEFFLELLEPLAFIDIDVPDDDERMDIWMDISKAHASFRQLNKKELVRFTSGMPRVDIYMAAREALEEAYKTGLALKRYIPVSRENLLDKIACYHAIGSKEYGELEDELVRDFQIDLDSIDDILG